MDFNITKSQEEYIKTIYILSNISDEVRVTDISNKLKVSKPSVTKTLKILNENNFVNYEVYGKITLTSLGVDVARKLIKKQDTLMNFLFEILNVEEKVAESESAILKHYLSESTIKKIDDHVNKILDLGKTNCGFDENKEKCKKCIKYSIKSKLNLGGNKC